MLCVLCVAAAEDVVKPKKEQLLQVSIETSPDVEIQDTKLTDIGLGLCQVQEQSPSYLFLQGWREGMVALSKLRERWGMATSGSSLHQRPHQSPGT